jgi:CRP-like cAMP-binding protein
MDTPTIDERLAQVPLFHGLSQQQLRRIAELATELDLVAGSELTVEGEPGREFFVVIEGEAEVTRGGRVVATRGPGSYLGEIALLLGRARTATVVATTDMRVEVIERAAFTRLLSACPELYEPLLAAVARQLAEHDHEP